MRWSDGERRRRDGCPRWRWPETAHYVAVLLGFDGCGCRIWPDVA
jgi:hypothetical protein